MRCIYSLYEMTVLFILTHLPSLTGIKIDNFDILHNRTIVQERNGTVSIESLSEIHCTCECSRNNKCCFVTYNMTTELCTLDFTGCCYPKTGPSINGQVLNKMIGIVYLFS